MLSKRAAEILGDREVAIVGPSGLPTSGRGPVYDNDRRNPAYTGGSRFDAQIALWNPYSRSADNEILADKRLIDARAKDAARNDSFVDSSVAIHKDSIVGSQFMLNLKPNRQALGLTASRYDKWEEEFQEEVEALWALETESNDCFLDAARSQTFTEMVRMAVGILATGGEVLATAEWDKDKTRPFKTCINFVDADRLGTPFGTTEGPNMRGGVEMNDFGAPLAFHICDAYPNDPWAAINGSSFNYTRVIARTPWGRPQVIYLKDKKRAGQTRGISAMVTALKEWKMTKNFRDTTLQNAIVNAMYAASIESEFPDEAFASLGAGQGDYDSVVSGFAGAMLGGIDKYTGGKGSALMLEGVKIPHLFPGTKLQLRAAGTPGGVGTEFESSLLRYLAAALGVSYEQLSKNYTDTNYSSIRAAFNETLKSMLARKRMGADRFASTCLRLWFEERANAGRFTTLTSSMPGIYIDQNLNAYTACDWIGAARGQIDELKETQGAMLRLAAGISSYEIECGRLGVDWRQLFRQQQREQNMRKELGLPLQSQASATNTKNAASAKPEAPGTGGTAGEDDEEADDETN